MGTGALETHPAGAAVDHAHGRGDAAWPSTAVDPEGAVVEEVGPGCTSYSWLARTSMSMYVMP